MRKVLFAMIVVLAVSPIPVSADFAGNAWWGNSYGNTAGGEFITHPSGDWSAERVDVPAPQFETFCVERNEFLQFGPTFNVDIDPSAVKGGLNGGSPDPLDARTRWLYSEFIRGTLDGYDYGTGADRVASANALQAAIWYLEQEVTATMVNGLSYADAVWDFVDLAAGKDSSGVQVMNLWRTDNLGGSGRWNENLQRYEYQSLLILVPVPSAVLLGMIGLGLIGWVRRRIS